MPEQHPTFEDVAGVIADINEEVLNTQTMIRDVEQNLSHQIERKVTESEGRLLTAIRGIEEQLTRIEERILEDHQRRIQALEEKIGIR